MDHSEAVHQMAAEKYLLDELPAEVRDAFEEHMFDCPECAFDIRAGVAFMDEAKLQLPALTAVQEDAQPEPTRAMPVKRADARADSGSRLPWWRTLFASPAFAGPVFATLLIVVGYQNLVTYPALRNAATEPHLVPSVALHAGTRGGEAVTVEASRTQGVLLQVDMSGHAGFTAYSVDLYDPQGKLAWTRNLTREEFGVDSETLSLVIPGAGLQQGEYALAISGVASSGQRTEIERKKLDVHLND
jgi:hypothetical protein